MAFVINVIKWLLWTVETMYFDVVEPVFFISTASSPARFATPEHWVPSRGRSESAALGVCVYI